MKSSTCPTLWTRALHSGIRRCQGFRVRAACESGAAPESYSLISHGGGSTTQVGFWSPFFMELRGYSRWTCLLHQVIIPSNRTTRVFPACLSFQQSRRVTVNDFPPSLNSEEAQSTTWLHPVGGEAIRTGHRKTPGKGSVNGGQVCPLSPRCSPSCAAV